MGDYDVFVIFATRKLLIIPPCPGLPQLAVSHLLSVASNETYSASC